MTAQPPRPFATEEEAVRASREGGAPYPHALRVVGGWYGVGAQWATGGFAVFGHGGACCHITELPEGTAHVEPFPAKLVVPAGALATLVALEAPARDDGEASGEVATICERMATRLVLRTAAEAQLVARWSRYWAERAQNASTHGDEFPSRQAARGLWRICRAVEALLEPRR